MPYKAYRVTEKDIWLTKTRKGESEFYGTTIVIPIVDWLAVKKLIDDAVAGPVKRQSE